MRKYFEVSDEMIVSTLSTSNVFLSSSFRLRYSPALLKKKYFSFLSSSADRQRVLDRVAAVTMSAGLDVFFDCLSLHPSEEWKLRLAAEIKKRDLFLLFWSIEAKDSQWVSWEWHKALDEKGISAMQIQPLQTGREAPPPEELKELHFGDPYMLARRAYESLSSED